MNDSNQREFSRLSKESEIQINIIEYPVKSNKPVQGTTKNITPQGICFLANQAYQVKTVVNIKISLPGWRRHFKNTQAIINDELATEPLSAIAEIVWCKKVDSGHYEIGLKFINIYEDDYVALSKYCEQL